MELSIKPSSFFFKFFSLILVFQVSVVWSATFLLATNPNTDIERKYWIITDDDPPIGAAEQTVPTYYIHADKFNPDREIPEELRNLIQPLDPVENEEAPNPPTAPKDLLQLMDNHQLTAQISGIPIFIPNIPPGILPGATYQAISFWELEGEFCTTINLQSQEHQHTALVFQYSNAHLIDYLYGRLPSGTPYLLTTPQGFSREGHEKLLQLIQQRDRQEENKNQPEGTDDSYDDETVEDDSGAPVQGAENDITATDKEAEATEGVKEKEAEAKEEDGEGKTEVCDTESINLSKDDTGYDADTPDSGFIIADNLVSPPQREQQQEARSPTPIPGHDKGKKESDGSNTDAEKNTGAIENNQETSKLDREEQEQDREEGADKNTVEGPTDHLAVITVAPGHGQNNTSENQEEEPVVGQIVHARLIYIHDIGTPDSQPKLGQ